jgi:hypothetical protein
MRTLPLPEPTKAAKAVHMPAVRREAIEAVLLQFVLSIVRGGISERAGDSGAIRLGFLRPSLAMPTRKLKSWTK